MRLSDIDLRLLRVFQAVADAGGFAKAQGALGISQPAISTQIAKLEDRLGIRLCDRGPKGFALTPEGEQVLQETKRLLDHLDAAAARLNAIAAPEEATIRIGVVDCMVTDTNNPLIPTLRALHDERPTLNVQIGIYDFLGCLEELQAGRLDICIIGIAGNERIPTDIEAVPLYRETSSLYCSPAHPCAKDKTPDALRETLGRSLISAHSFVFNPIDRDLDPMLLDHSSGVAQDTIELTAYLALCGSHVGLLPDHYADYWVTAGKLVPVRSEMPKITSDFHAVRRKSGQDDPVIRDVWRRLQDYATLKTVTE